MRLVSTNGNSLELRLTGYEFPEATAGEDGDDFDANWLLVSGTVVRQGRHWSFRDPCLLTWDVRALSAWLRSVSDGSRQPESVDPAEPDAEGGGLLAFTEPNLAFNLHGRTPDSATIRVYLSLEARPPGSETRLFEDFVELTLSNDALSTALAEWEAELRRFPARP